MPEATIYIRTNNSEKYIRKAIESCLKQDSVKFELLIVDDSSSDDTLQIVKSFSDPRIRLIENTRHRGSAYCNNLVIRESRSPFIVFADSDYIFINDSIKRLLERIRSSDKIGLVYCYNFSVDQSVNITRDYFHKLFHYKRSRWRRETEYLNGLLYKGREIDGLRVYRREIFEEVGGFDDTIESDANYDVTLRILEKFEIALLPGFLYCVIKANNKSDDHQPAGLRNLASKLRINKKLDNASILKKVKYKRYKVIFNALYRALHLEIPDNILRNILNISYEYSNRKVSTLFFNRIYKFIITKFSWWPIDLFIKENQKFNSRNKRIAYYIWRFPVLSQTFIQREVAALLMNGQFVEVISEKSSAPDYLDEYRNKLSNHMSYLDSVDDKKLSEYKKYFFLKNPLLYLNLFLYVLFHDYHPSKGFRTDKLKFSKAVRLAGMAKDDDISHIHSPWADNCALVALIASKLLGITCSVQGRAHDIHRKIYLNGLKERFVGTDFVITNTQYNLTRIESVLCNHINNGVNLIYNGLNLEEFKPSKKIEKLSTPVKILSVARLIEQKGLVYLLNACKILKDKGYNFECKIIGSPENIFMSYYLNLKLLHRKLGLNDCVSFLGSRPFSNVMEEYRNADIFVLPCVIAEDGSRDITPNSLIEAMAMKLPVVSTRVSGIPEIIDDGLNGLLVTPNSVSELTEAIIRLIEDDEIRRDLGENARKKVEEKFNIKKNIVQYVELFKGAYG